MQYCKAYNQSLAFLGTLDNAKTSYILKDTPLSNGKIILPVDDAGNDLCTPYNFVELYDGDERVDMFRVIAMPQSSIKATGGTYTHKLEHALATLMDKLMPGTHEIGGTGVTMTDCITYILGFQSTAYWQLGRCDFTTQFQYSFTDNYLLPALLSLPKQLDEPYLWTTDTTTTPWTLNLVRPTATIECEMRYRHNMLEIGKTYDASELCTRCYPRGYGEGMNQLGIASVNSGVAYLDADAATIARWGTVEKPFVDKTIEHADALKRRAAQWLEAYKNPRFCYTAKAIDLYRLTGEPFEQFYPGKLCRVIDEEHGITVTVRVTQIAKSDPAGKPGDITVTFSNQAANVANEIADLAGRASVNELYAQGATNMFQIPFCDNADKDHPIEVDVDIPTECVRVNKLWLILHIGHFRSTSRGAAAGGGTTSTSSTSGGQTKTSSDGGYRKFEKAQSRYNSSGITDELSSSYTGSTSLTADNGGGGNTEDSDNTSHMHTCDTNGSHSHQIGTSWTSSAGTHNHTINYNTCSHKHYVYGHTHTIAAHSHTFNHVHNFSYSYTIPALTIEIPAHSHSVTVDSHNHEINLLDHTHNDMPGIYEHGTVDDVAVSVDGTAVPASAITDGQINLIPYLSKDQAGRITRSNHSITLTPVPTEANADGLCRITGNASCVVFIRSQGGGDY